MEGNLQTKVCVSPKKSRTFLQLGIRMMKFSLHGLFFPRTPVN